MRIQVDMFAVELGAAMLIQFETSKQSVRILADAGEAHRNVRDKLIREIGGLGNHDDPIRIDLLIGTHYDADHLGGLVDIIRDTRFEIGEAWLPPVANDTDVHAADSVPHDSDLLALQFCREDGPAVLRRYLADKANLCARLSALEREADDLLETRRERFEFEWAPQFGETWNALLEADSQTVEAFFQAHIKDAARTIGVEEHGHGEEDIADPWEAEVGSPEAFSGYDYEYFTLRDWSVVDPSLARWSTAAVQTSTLAMIRQAAARDAINARSLAAVVQALKNRNIPIRSATIRDGEPRLFHWHPADGRFTPIGAAVHGAPKLVLLGPSDGLVKKYWDRLPIGTYMMTAAFKSLPIKPITASNQLSYVMALEFIDQRILITGDAGMVDFKEPGKRTYYPALTGELSPLHVVQVAHHGGANAHFYRALMASAYPNQGATSHLLLSHATQDKHRPSDVFSNFIAALGTSANHLKLLFTSEPKEEKVRDVKSLIAPNTTVSASSGDVRLTYENGAWQVAQHIVQVP